MIRRRRRPIASLAFALLFVACAGARGPADPRAVMATVIAEGHSLHARERHAEASALLAAVARIDPQHQGAAGLRAALGSDWSGLAPQPLLGSSHAMRPALKRPVYQRALLYLPDRALDLLDVISLGNGFGNGAFVDVHATRALQLALGKRHTVGYGAYSPRSWGAVAHDELGAALGPWGALDYDGSRLGTAGPQGGSARVRGLHRPTAPLYQTLRDYWSIGASAHLGIFGLDVELHPLQLADFVAGWLFVDFLRDDRAHTRGLELSPWQRELLAELAGAELPPRESLPASPTRRR